MDVERHDMDYEVNLTALDINALCGYLKGSGVPEVPLRAEVKGPIKETLSLSCNRDPDFLSRPGVQDQILFKRGVEGPEVEVYPQALVMLLGTREFWVTRYDWENKILLRRGEESIIRPR